jgi:translation elongation factor EF-G
VLAEGAIAGYPLQDLQVSVYDGKYHAVDSKEVAFVSAGRKAFLDAILKNEPHLTPVRECLDGTLLAIAAEESIKRRCVVEIE